MLCITIKEGEQFTIGETMLFVKKYSSNSYRVYIQAPKSLKISRSENENKQAVSDSVSKHADSFTRRNKEKNS